jgi:hypothetical protein
MVIVNLFEAGFEPLNLRRRGQPASCGRAVTVASLDHVDEREEVSVAHVRGLAGSQNPVGVRRFA